MARSLLIDDPVLVAELGHLAPRIAAHLFAAAQEGRPGAESAADAWLDLAMTYADHDGGIGALQPTGR